MPSIIQMMIGMLKIDPKLTLVILSISSELRCSFLQLLNGFFKVRNYQVTIIHRHLTPA